VVQLTSAPSDLDFQLLLKHLLHTPLAHAPHQEIVYRDLRRYDYTELVERIGRVAAGLEALGVRQGDTVAVMDWDSHRYLECFFAVPMMGAVLHTINIRLSPEQMLYTINHAGDDLILVHDDFLPLLAQIRDRIDKQVTIVRLTDVGGAVDTDLELAYEYEQLVAAGSPAYEFVELDENLRATTFYTTGTTGLPKGVYFSHRQLVLHTLSFMATLGWTENHARFHKDDVYMPITPMFHVHAWGIPYVATLMGVKQVYPGRYEPSHLLELIGREGVTFSHCVPTILHMLLSSPAAEKLDLSGWKVVVGGAAMPKGLARRALALGIDVFTGYGLSESGPLLCLSQVDRKTFSAGGDEHLSKRCKSGRPSPLVELKVVDEDGNEQPWDGAATGEVVARAPWLTPGYLKDQEGSQQLWRGGYLHTGDIATRDAEGYLQVTDRIKDVIKSGGEWISSLELEDIISQIEGVSEVAAIGVPDEKWGERPLVLIVPTPGYTGALSEAAVKERVRAEVDRGRISRWAEPDRVELVETIEKTSVGKIDKKLLRRKYQ
jgi:fatty-acyl-CoA synthase